MSRQKRIRVFRGNPDKNEDIVETTADDPDPAARPLAYPINDVEGNDDDLGPTDEDSNPYDEGVGTIPGHGKMGTLSSIELEDAAGENGETFRIRRQFMEFVRVQLGNTWYRCSDFGLWRHHTNIQKGFR